MRVSHIPPTPSKKNKTSVSESKLVYVMFLPLDLAFEPPHYHTALKGFCKNNFLGTSCCSLSSFISQWCWFRAACSSATGSQAEQQRLGETLVSARSLKPVAMFYISDSDWPLTFFFFFSILGLRCCMEIWLIAKWCVFKKHPWLAPEHEVLRVHDWTL